MSKIHCSCLMMIILAALVCRVSAKTVAVDFEREVGRIRPELHSSSFSALMNDKGVPNNRIKAMNFHAVRTHDLALVNFGARVVDNHFIFPLEHLDAADPKNYYFEQTDYLLDLQRKMGLKIFYRLGTSIEHTGTVHFNARIPKDFDKVAENFAATIRHYNRGWANGKEWNIRYWEIWNEPDGCNTMWSVSGKDDSDKKWEVERRNLYIKFFVTCLKRLKSEFPEVKIGGPALCGYNEYYVRALLKACAEAKMKPDFISWHYYGRDPEEMVAAAEKVRKVYAEYGFDDIESIINEWHYLPKGKWKALSNRDPLISTPAQIGPGSIVGVDSACFTLAALIRLQSSQCAQAYFYGCRPNGWWGYRDDIGRVNKVFHALKAFGSIVRNYSRIAAATSDDKSVFAFPVISANGEKAVLVVDYLGSRDDITLTVKGCDAKPVVTVLSDELDFIVRPVQVNDAKILLPKPDANSVAFWVTF